MSASARAFVNPPDAPISVAARAAGLSARRVQEAAVVEL
jgi:hypothetical protein